jgi:hypothetical protein
MIWCYKQYTNFPLCSVSDFIINIFNFNWNNRNMHRQPITVYLQLKNKNCFHHIDFNKHIQQCVNQTRCVFLMFHMPLITFYNNNHNALCAWHSAYNQIKIMLSSPTCLCPSSLCLSSAFCTFLIYLFNNIRENFSLEWFDFLFN